MPDTASHHAEAAAPDLPALRAELDRLDDAIHDLLMRRAAIVARIGADGAKGRMKWRPGREAAILRRLLARHAGVLPPQALVRIWRELFAASTALQAPFTVAVVAEAADGALAACAREHFGALTPQTVDSTPAQAIASVRAGGATVAVLPLPAAGEASARCWWTALLRQETPRLYVVARLPFWAPRPPGAPGAGALVLAAVAPDASGRDRTLLGVEHAEADPARLAQEAVAAGFVPGEVMCAAGPDAGMAALIDVDGSVADDDPRLAAFGAGQRRPRVLGAYAVPLDGGCA